MKKLPQKILKNIIKRCKRNKKQESCGLVMQDVNNKIHVIPTTNNSKTPEKSFVIDADEVKMALQFGKFLGYYHSHLDDDENLSMIDKAMAETLQKMSIVYSLKTNKISCYKPEGWLAPLEGRPYAHGIFDSFTLFKDYYRGTIHIENNFSYHRYIKPIREISVNNNEILSKLLKKYNFRQKESLEEGDVIIISKDKQELDLGIYTEGKVLTHLPDELSQKYDMDYFENCNLTFYGKFSKD